MVLARLLTIALLLSSPVARTSVASIELEVDDSGVVVSASSLVGRPAITEVPPRSRAARAAGRHRPRRRVATARVAHRTTLRRSTGVIRRAVLYADEDDDDDDERR